MHNEMSDLLFLKRKLRVAEFEDNSDEE